MKQKKKQLEREQTNIENAKNEIENLKQKIEENKAIRVENDERKKNLEELAELENQKKEYLKVLKDFESKDPEKYEKYINTTKNMEQLNEFWVDNIYTIEQWMKKNIGTVHTFQGKGADEVIFLLGCDNQSITAANWVNKNIVNVAATRAKFRFYVIGDEKVWTCKPVQIAREQINHTISPEQLDE